MSTNDRPLNVCLCTYECKLEVQKTPILKLMVYSTYDIKVDNNNNNNNDTYGT